MAKLAPATPRSLGERDERAFGERLLVALEAAGTLGRESAERARRAHERTKSSIVDILIRLALCEEKSLAEQVAAVLELPLCEAKHMPEMAIRAGSISVPFLREARVLPLAETSVAVLVAAVDPSDQFMVTALNLVFTKPVTFLVATPSQIEQGIQSLYARSGEPDSPQTPSFAASDVTDTDLVRLRESASEAPIVRFVERLIAKSIDEGASDIHIEPLERRLRIRLRIDGMLIDEDPAVLSSAPAIVSRIKILARLDIAERRLPQDGSIKMNVRGRDVDLRVATSPVTYGEAVVIRILDRESIPLDLKALGFDHRLLQNLERILDRPNGIILVTGPTGSGKSTTLYAALTRLNVPTRKIVTVEDPVEYKIDGLNQIQVKPDIGLDFARSLRSLLRHDPDVVMVGEIRDGETARIAMQAALTGHLVLSTLHTNDAASAATRLLDMGIEDYLVTSTISGVLAQRLVRSLCVACRKRAEIPAALVIAVEQRQARAEPTSVFEPVGCPSCRGTGYRGRTVIGELLTMSGDIRKAILRRAEAANIRTVAVESGMETLYENGLRAVFAGTTSYEEVLRVAKDVAE